MTTIPTAARASRWPARPGSSSTRPRRRAEGAARGRVRLRRLALPPDQLLQEGTDVARLPAHHGDEVGRSTLFGIPLQQTWSYANSGNFAPTYYLQTDAPLYYYSFTDALIAMAYLRSRRSSSARFDPMITGFNPADMYAADHIRRVLQTFPGVFCGIGEFTIHKEFVSSKVAGEAASLTNPALDRILDFAGEAGLVVLIHNDIDMPFAKTGTEPVYLTQMKDLLRRHPRRDDHLGAHGARARGAPGRRRLGAARGAERQALRASSRTCSPTRRCATSTSTSAGTRSPSTSWRHPRPPAARPR